MNNAQAMSNSLFDLDAEGALLGAIMLDNTLIDGVVDEIGTKWDTFFSLPNRLIYHAIYQLYKKDKASQVDPITIKSFLLSQTHTIDGVKYKKAGMALDDVGGAEYIAALWESGSSYVNIDGYIDVLKEKYSQRKMAHILNEAMSHIGGIETSVLADMLVKDVEDVTKDSESFVPDRIDGIMDAEIVNIEMAMRNGGNKDKFAYSGMKSIDKIVGGFEPGQFVIIAARTSMGKTQFAATLAKNFSLAGRGTLFMSLEMTSEEVARRIMLSGTNTTQSEVKQGFIGESSIQQMREVAKKFGKAPLYIDDRAGVSVQDISRKIRAVKRKHQLDVVIIDYLQLISMESDDLRKGTVKITRELKKIAKSHKVCIIALSQLNREVEKRDKKEPRLSDLRESGSIEEDADIVMFLHRDSYYDHDPMASYLDDKLKVIIAKHRNGPIGAPILYFNVSRGEIRDRREGDSRGFSQNASGPY